MKQEDEKINILEKIKNNSQKDAISQRIWEKIN